MSDQIINTYDQCQAFGGDRIAIIYRRQESGRGFRAAAWQIHRIVDGLQVKTKIDAPWYDYGLKTFSLFGHTGTPSQRRKAAFEEAKKWADENFGVRQYVKNGFGDFVEMEVNKSYPIRRNK